MGANVVINYLSEDSDAEQTKSVIEAAGTTDAKRKISKLRS
jgi:hypothetical protein